MQKIIGLVLICFLIACAENNSEVNEFSLQGKFKDNYEGYIVFSHGEKRDSVIVENNAFLFEGKIESIDENEAYLELENAGNLGVLFLDKTTINVDVEHKEIESQNKIYNNINIKNITGSENHKL